MKTLRSDFRGDEAPPPGSRHERRDEIKSCLVKMVQSEEKRWDEAAFKQTFCKLTTAKGQVSTDYKKKVTGAASVISSFQ
ncbi:uncharacterized protein V6R79_015241 [Siganus canaliculatus]